MKYDCLMIDDEESIAQTTSEYFNLFGLSCAYVCSYESCMEFMEHNQVSLLLLDINLGDRSGFVLCKELRERFTQPILFISARTSDEDILTALNIGGDDYIKKPYSLSILLAKVKAVLKRCSPMADQVQSLQVKDISVDLLSRKITCKGEPVKLKEMEYKLLTYLMKHPNRVIPKEELLEQVWQNTYVGEGTLSVHMRHLREKLEEDPNEPRIFQTVWGTGYRLENEG